MRVLPISMAAVIKIMYLMWAASFREADSIMAPGNPLNTSSFNSNQYYGSGSYAETERKWFRLLNLLRPLMYGCQIC